jgi:hypothetical protein
MAFIEIVRQPLYGSVYFENGEFIYTPNVGFSGNDSYSYVDTQNGTPILYTKYVNPYNTPPISLNASLSVTTYGEFIIPISALAVDLTNPFETFKIIDTEKANFGQISTDGAYIYYNTGVYEGVESLKYQISDKQFTTTGILTLSVINYKLRLKPFNQRLYDVSDQIKPITELSAAYNWCYDFLVDNSAYLNSLPLDTWMGMSFFTEKVSAYLIDLYSHKDDFINLNTVLNTYSAEWIQDANCVLLVNRYKDFWQTAIETLSSRYLEWNKTSTDLPILSVGILDQIDKLNQFYNIVNSNSSIWDTEEINSVLSSTSAYWETTKDTVTANIDLWNDTYTKTNTFSGFYYDNSSEYNSLYNLINSNSAEWNKKIELLYSAIAPNSANWNDIYNSKILYYDNLVSLLTTISSNWISDRGSVDILNDIMLSASNFTSTYETLTTNNSIWSNLTTFYTDISTAPSFLNDLFSLINNISSSDWQAESLNSLTNTNSSKWDVLYPFLNGNYPIEWNSYVTTYNQTSSDYYTNKPNFDYIFNIISSNSGIWTTKFSKVSSILNANSANWNSFFENKTTYDNLLSLVSSTSSNWPTDVNASTTLKNLILLSADNWLNTTDTLQNNTDIWNSLSGSYDYFNTEIEKVINFYNTIYNISANFNTIYLNSFLSGLSTNWSNTNDFLINTDYVNSWDTTYNTFTYFNSAYFNYTPFANYILSNYNFWNSNVNSLTTIIKDNSANWNSFYENKDLYDTLGLKSDIYVSDVNTSNSIKDTYLSGYSNWNSAFSTISANYIILDFTKNFINNLINRILILGNVYDIVHTDAVKWNAEYFRSLLNPNSSVWVETYNLLTAISSNWINLYNTSQYFSSVYYINRNNFNNLNNLIFQKINDWNNLKNNTESLLSSNSANWVDIYSYKVKFDDIYSVSNSNSGYWQTTVSAAPLINNLLTTNSSNSAKWVDIYNNKQKFDGHFSIISSQSAKWYDKLMVDEIATNNLFVVFSSNSANWIEVFNNKFNYDNAVNTVTSLSSGWNLNFEFLGKIAGVSNALKNNSANWIDIYNNKQIYDDFNYVITSYSPNWINYRFFDYITNLQSIISSNSANWIDIYNSKSNYDNLNYIITSYSYNWIYDTYNILNIINNIDVNKSILSSNSALWVDYVNLLGSISSNQLVYNDKISYWNTPYSLLTAFSGFYLNKSENYNSIYQIVCSNSAKWISTYPPYNILSSGSANWDSVYERKDLYYNNVNLITSLCTTYITFSPTSGVILRDSQYYNLASNYIYLSSIKLDNIFIFSQYLSSFIKPNTDKFNSLYETVTAYGGTIWNISIFNNILTSYSDDWDGVYDVLFVDNYVATWDNVHELADEIYNNVNTLNSNINPITSIISDNYLKWQDRTNLSLLTSNSSIWDSFTTSLCQNSGNWIFNEKDTFITTYTYTSSTSASLNSIFNLITTYSANWITDSINALNPITAIALSGSDTIDFSVRDIRGYGVGNFNNLSASRLYKIGSFAVTLTSLSVYNTSTNAALSVFTVGNYNGVSRFNDSVGNDILYVNAQNNNVVGINITPSLDTTTALTVSGNLSATGSIATYLQDQITKYAQISTSYINAYSILSSSSATIDGFDFNKYDSLYNYYALNSSNIDPLNGYYQTVVDSLTTQTYINNVLSSYIVLSGDNFGVDTYYRQNSALYDNAYTYFNSTSSEYLTSYNVSYLFGYNTVRKNTSGIIYLKEGVTINTWSMQSDQPTFASVDILYGKYNNYPRLTSIIGNNIPHLDSSKPIKNKGVAYDDHWIHELEGDSYLKFVLKTNTNANYILINLNVTKR